MKFNHPHPALWRFGDDVLSEVYAEAINFADEEGDQAFQYRDWTNEMSEKRAGERPPIRKRETCTRRAWQL